MFINRVGKSIKGVVDVQVGASANDGYWDAAASFDATYDNMFLGKTGSSFINFFAMWTGINIPAGAKIIDATVYLYLSSCVGTPSGNLLYMNDAATPTAPTTASGANGKAKTTASVACNPSGAAGWKTYDVKSIVEELMASYSGYSNGVMMALAIGAGSEMNYASIRSYDYTGNAHGPRLVINWMR